MSLGRFLVQKDGAPQCRFLSWLDTAPAMDRHFLWDWHSRAPEQEPGENAAVREVADELDYVYVTGPASNGRAPHSPAPSRRSSRLVLMRLDLPRPRCALKRDDAGRPDEHDPGHHEPRRFRRAPKDLE